MKNLFLISVLYLQTVLSYGVPDQTGVGAVSYQDSAGNRYGGTYGLRDGQVVDIKGDFPPNFHFNTYQDLDNFFPEYFRNLGNLLQEAFNANLDSQRLAFNAAQKAFDLTSNQAGYIPNFNYPGVGNFPNFGEFPSVPFAFPTMPNFGNDFSAFAAAVANPGFRQQIAAINPSNPAVPNVNEVKYSNSGTPGNNGGYMAVSSSSYSTSSQNADGQVTNSRAAETVINDNGKITKYSVKS